MSRKKLRVGIERWRKKEDDEVKVKGWSRDEEEKRRLSWKRGEIIMKPNADEQGGMKKGEGGKKKIKGVEKKKKKEKGGKKKKKKKKAEGEREIIHARCLLLVG